MVLVLVLALVLVLVLVVGIVVVVVVVVVVVGIRYFLQSYINDTISRAGGGQDREEDSKQLSSGLPQAFYDKSPCRPQGTMLPEI